MAVHLTRIYTRTGDDGTTGLSDFSRVSKNDPRLVAYADCDEANSAIGVAIAVGQPDEEIADVLRQIQNDLFDAGADLSTPSWWRTPSIRRCESPSPTSIGSRGGATDTTKPAGAEFLCAAGRFAVVGAVARRPHGGPSSRALGVGRGRCRTRSGSACCRRNT